MTSLYKIAEKCLLIVPKVPVQALLSSVVDVYASLAKKEWYENKADGVSEVDGNFLYTFGKSSPLVPEVDSDTELYYITIPSAYLRLPHEMGINTVSFMKEQNYPFVRVASMGLWNNLKANVFKQTYMVEGNRLYFPKMTSVNKGNILLKMAIALDTADVDQQLNIPPNMVDEIVNIVVSKYQPKEPKTPENLM